MKITDNMKMCTGCGACANICSHHAVMMVEKEGFLYPEINLKECQNCGMCSTICPTNFYNENIVNNKEISIYAAKASDIIRKQSSSGGVFSACAEVVFKLGGVVCGAYYDENFVVRHGIAERMEDLDKFRGSKYVQSDIGNTYKEIKAYLTSDRYVLFSGTPCQVDGLKKYLKKEYSKLYCLDVICHGVPSPAIWKKYIDYERKKAGIKEDVEIQKINMRDKVSGYYTFSFSFSDGRTISMPAKKSLWMKFFTGDVCLRESCYQCKYKSKYHPYSDLTMGDAWGLEKIHPNLYDDKGISLVIVHSEKGEQLLNQCELERIEIESKILAGNEGLLKSASVSRHYLKKFLLKKGIERSFERIWNDIKMPLFFTKVMDKLKS